MYLRQAGLTRNPTPTMYLRQAGLTRNPTFSYLYCVRCRGQGVASEAPLERKYSRWASLPLDNRVVKLNHDELFTLEVNDR